MMLYEEIEQAAMPLIRDRQPIRIHAFQYIERINLYTHDFVSGAWLLEWSTHYSASRNQEWKIKNDLVKKGAILATVRPIPSAEWYIREGHFYWGFSADRDEAILLALRYGCELITPSELS